MLSLDEKHYRRIRPLFDFVQVEENFRLLLSARRYCSLPPEIEARIGLCDELVLSGFDLSRVPGFFRIPDDAPDEEFRGCWCFCGDRWGQRAVGDGEVEWDVRGLLVPVRNVAGRIVGFELHNDLPPAGASARARRLWPAERTVLLSHHLNNDKRRGSTGGARLHYAPPPPAGWDAYPDGVFVTDSALRADILATRYSVHALGVLHFGMLVDEILQVVSRFRRILVIADLGDEDAVDGLCRSARVQGVRSKVVLYDRRAGGAFFDSDVSFRELIREPEDTYFDEYDQGDIFNDADVWDEADGI